MIKAMQVLDCGQTCPRHVGSHLHAPGAAGGPGLGPLQRNNQQACGNSLFPDSQLSAALLMKGA